MMDFSLGAALPDHGVPIGVAVSGGPDSLALLLMAAARGPLRAATVDHGLRAGAREEAEFVARACAERGIAHDILTVALAPGAGQAEARAARYGALGSWCVKHGLTHLATAHHIDDQAETLLMRAARGAGLGGLAGVRARRVLCAGVTLIRPLLDRRKRELEAIAAAAGLVAIVDPSNGNQRYDRTAARDLLAATPWLDPERLAQSAAYLAEAEGALVWATERAFADHVTGAGFDPADLPPEIVRRVMLRLFAGFGAAPRGPELARLIAALRAGRAVTLGGVKAVPGRLWTLSAAPPHRGKPG